MFTRIFGTIALAVALLPSLAAAQNFPFTITRDSDGKIAKIELPKKSNLDFELSEEDELLADLKKSYIEFKESKTLLASDFSRLAPESKEDREAYARTKAFLNKKFNPELLSDVNLQNEVAKAKIDLKKALSLRLLAAPYSPASFDEAQALEHIIDLILKGAKQVISVGPVFDIFEFVLGEYIEALKSRREFYQNQLLVILDSDDGSFTNEEKSLIRSSIFYSRLSLIKLGDRKDARKHWATFGDKTQEKISKKCKGFVDNGDAAYGNCFKIDGTQIRNGLVKRSMFEKKPSVAYDANKPYSVRDLRRFLLLAKLAIKLVPVPVVGGPIKSALSSWINSNYVNQRKSEGLLFGSLKQAGDDNLAAWIVTGSANPILMK